MHKVPYYINKAMGILNQSVTPRSPARSYPSFSFNVQDQKFKMATVQILTSLGMCSGWSESAWFAHVLRFKFQVHRSMNTYPPLRLIFESSV